MIARCLPLWQNLSQDHNGRGTASMELIHRNIYTGIIHRLRAEERVETVSNYIDIIYLTVQ
jgi:hypothetical protein